MKKLMLRILTTDFADGTDEEVFIRAIRAIRGHGFDPRPPPP
jgi:hypothetical protein